ncbi:SDR family NAD(P)-dependent oxidoreductase [Paratissierella segnis]|uniref:SDR family oxidoreductase n=1 Tax=Paratissierella segnis TaxID=2763679 RepID=A0A926EYH1_9FIRM|nr:SDR family oxidoreductase [Paratissierella segnis]MBC8588609.1 SDR family oxidoreductase [Paratissierella segnis]
MKRFNNKVAVVTGGTSGIGLAVVKDLLTEGANVIMSASDKVRGLDVEKKLQEYHDRVNFFCCDVSNEGNVKELFRYVNDMFGRLDILHNNAGVSMGSNLENTTSEEWEKTLDVNLKGAFLCSKYALNMLKNSNSGVIINTISELGIVATKNCIAYLCSKGGLIQLTRGMALELAPYGIRVNAVCPASTDTPMFHADMDSDGNYEENVKRLVKSYPLGRIAKPEEISPAVLYLASEEASFITGQYIVLDGGFTIQ